MSAFLLTPAAIADLDDIWQYGADRWSAEQAERYIRELITACQGLADKRLKGRAISDVRAGYFKLSVGSHFVCYRIIDAGLIDVVRILHQRMDIPERLE